MKLSVLDWTKNFHVFSVSLFKFSTPNNHDSFSFSCFIFSDAENFVDVWCGSHEHDPMQIAYQGQAFAVYTTNNGRKGCVAQNISLSEYVIHDAKSDACKPWVSVHNARLQFQGFLSRHKWIQNETGEISGEPGREDLDCGCGHPEGLRGRFQWGLLVPSWMFLRWNTAKNNIKVSWCVSWEILFCQPRQTIKELLT